MSLKWSWSYCDCMDPATLCPTKLRCAAHLEWDALQCICKTRFQDGEPLSASDFQQVDPSNPNECILKPACQIGQDLDEATCTCVA